MSKFFRNFICLSLLLLFVTPVRAEYQLIWSDEFAGKKLNLKNWEPMLGNGDEYGIPGWGNGELQYYTARKKNIFLKDGNLVIRALKEKYKGFEHTSARLRSAGKQEFLYGKIEARIKLPSGQGMWPAFWMLPTDSPYGYWPMGGEIDILEAANEHPAYVYGGIFFGGPWPNSEHLGVRSTYQEEPQEDLSADFHIYTFEWQPNEMRWFLDGKLFATQNHWRSYQEKDEAGNPTQIYPYPAPFNVPFHLLLNVAVGGGMTHVEAEEVTSEPAQMEVDWVRVYQTENKPPQVKITSPKEGEKIPGEKDVLIEVEATDSDGTIEKVEFYAFNELIGEDRTAPYSLSWAAPDDLYPILVKVYDNENFVAFEKREFIKGKGAPRGPFHGEPFQLPGRLEAEDFDLGPSGEAYFDTDTPNQGHRYRKREGVDIQDCPEGGYNLGWIKEGEWLNYTVNISESGLYDITFRVASLEGAGKLHLEIDGLDKTGILATPKTGAWEKYTDLIAYKVPLEAGKQVLRLVMDAGWFNFNYLEFVRHDQAGYQLIWSDEFEGDKINSDNWEAMIGDGSEYGIPGWGNEELQFYTGREKNTFVKDGKLVIQALRENYQGHEYTSARLRTAEKQDFLYGKMEARIKLPSGKGTWTAFWMMPTDYEYGTWAGSGEIDILEVVNAAPDRVMGSIFFGSPWPNAKHISRFSREGEEKGEDISQDFHIYGLEWQPNEMRWYLDDKIYSVQNRWESQGFPYPAPFDKRFHFLLNIAVGGWGPGAPPDETTPWPQQMLVDWVRVYQTENKPPEVKITSPQAGETIPQDKNVLIEVEAADPDGTIEKVEFYAFDELIGEDNAAPYSLSWAAPDDLHTISVKAYDNEDFVAFDTLSFTKGAGNPQRPFSEAPAVIPGQIEAENFDRGLPGEAYLDSDEPNQGARYRTRSEVDIQDCTEGGYNIAWIADGEWLEYTVNVAETGLYDIAVRVASPEGAGRFHLEIDGADKTGLLSTPKTGAWGKYTDVFTYGVELKAGEQVIRFVMDTGWFNFNYLKFTASPAEGAPKIYIASIVRESLREEGGVRGKATVTIRDTRGHPVSGVEVGGTFSGAYRERVYQTTDGNGRAVLITVKKTKKQGFFSRELEDFFFYVHKVKHPALSYDPNFSVKKKIKP